MKFGFIAHPTDPALKNQVGMLDLMGRLALDQEKGHYDDRIWKRKNIVPFTDFGEIQTPDGRCCHGVVYYLPLTAYDMLRQPKIAYQRVVEAVQTLKSDGAELIGLGGFTGIVGQRGEQTWRECDVPMTTGNSLTAFAAYRNLLDAMQACGIEPASAKVAIVGYPGSIALVVARLLLRHGCRLTLIHRAGRDAESHFSYLGDFDRGQVVLTDSVASTYADTRFFLGASSSGNLIDSTQLLPGSVVIDAALPKDVCETTIRRQDILLIDGGLVSAGPHFKLGTVWAEMSPRRQINGCLAETMVLTLEKRAENFSLGRILPEERVLEIGRLAEKVGLFPGPMAVEGKELQQADFDRLVSYAQKSQKALHHKATTELSIDSGLNTQDSVLITKEDSIIDLIQNSPIQLKNRVLQNFSSHLNPVLASFYRAHHIERVFSKGEGVWLTDLDGQRYLDFVAGYGCLNTGHNHPKVQAALQSYLQESHPSFVQYVSAPLHTSLLAERLADLMPGDLQRVFFSNSGTEAVEAALKIALAYHDKKRRIVYCDNGYHGKTLGALSVTGRYKHRRWFEPLLSNTSSIIFGDKEALENELRKGDVAAFILEPIQGEGGVILPPEDYLKNVRQLCSQYDALMIVDEVQTGLGRTGKLLNCQWHDVVPDIVVLSKSLSGGLVPIGATITTPTIWNKAWDDADRFAAHTSTFGGGNFAAAAAMATLDALENDQLAQRAYQVGNGLRNNLAEIAQNFRFIHAVRGQGLMIAVEFCPDFSSGLRAFAQELATRMPGNWQTTYDFLPLSVRQALQHATDAVEHSLSDLFVQKLVSKMANEHRILTFVTANNNRVMRIQPPLVLQESEAQQFVKAFEESCFDLSTVMN